jgi:hypothetical protein
MRGLAWVLAGTLSLSGAGSATAGGIVNGGFETGDFTGWTVNIDPLFTLVIGNSPPDTYAGFQSHTGTHFAALGDTPDLGTLSQTVSDTPGQNYTLSMYLAPDGQQPNEFKVQWNGVTLYDEVNIALNPPGDVPFLYSLLTFSVQGTGSDTLLLSEAAAGYMALDDVSLTAASIVPEPSSLILLVFGIGALGLAAGRWRERKQSA